MDLKLAGKRALITGASKGIGRATADVLAAEGCHLVLVARTGVDLETARREIAAVSSVRIDIVAADVAKGTTVERLARDFPDVDILVNNAGAIPGGTLLEIDEARWRAAWDLKVFGYINMCRAFYAAMKGRRGGVIVNIIGATAQSYDPHLICSTVGNAALTALTRSLGSVSAKDGVRVVAINPGLVTTDRMVTVLKKRAQDITGDGASWPDLVKSLPFGRAGTPAEIAATVAFLASEHSGYTSGTVLVIDAGLSARGHNV